MPVAVLLVVAVITVGTTAALRTPSRSASPGRRGRHRTGGGTSRYPGTGIRVANEFHLPTGTPIEIRLTSDNVIHSFWVPQIGGKVDLIPGQPNVFRFTIDRAGVYRGQCAEYCGHPARQHGVVRPRRSARALRALGRRAPRRPE